jgi:hypothetical protein
MRAASRPDEVWTAWDYQTGQAAEASPPARPVPETPVPGSEPFG